MIGNACSIGQNRRLEIGQAGWTKIACLISFFSNMDFSKQVLEEKWLIYNLILNQRKFRKYKDYPFAVKKGKTF